MISVFTDFSKKSGFWFTPGVNGGVGSKFSGRFEVKGLPKNYFYEFISNPVAEALTGLPNINWEIIRARYTINS